MTELFGVPLTVLYGQVLLGLVSGCFYALLSLGLAIIFGFLNIVNFMHGTMYMMGAFAGYILLTQFGMPYWSLLIIVPLLVGVFGVLIERLFLRKLYKLDNIYGLLLTFGFSMILEGLFRAYFGVSGQRFPTPDVFRGATDIGFMMLPTYRLWIVAASLTVCFGTWFVIEKTRLGATLRAGTENPKLVQAFGVNIPVVVSAVFGCGVALAAFTGLLAAPLMQINPLVGQSLIITVFAVVVIGGMGSIMGAILTGLGLGVIEGLAKVYYPVASSTVVFLVMVVVLLVRPNGLFGKQ